jgi:hypothetical protein
VTLLDTSRQWQGTRGPTGENGYNFMPRLKAETEAGPRHEFFHFTTAAISWQRVTTPGNPNFKTFIVSGGGVKHVHAFAEKVYDIPPEQVIGSTGKQQFEIRDGKPVLVKLPAVDFIDDKKGKPIAIQRVIGRRPIAAFGNSDGDLQMPQWTCETSGTRLCLYVHHTDAEREWAYDRQSSIGHLDKGLDTVTAEGWTVVDMKGDWKTIFAGEQ